jgi:hypothetical protein
MTEEQQPQPAQKVNPFVGDEGAFLRALGLDPGMVVSGTVRNEWRDGTPYILFQTMQPVPVARLGMAYLAAAPAEQQQQQPPPPGVPEDHRPPLAAVPPVEPGSGAADDTGDPPPAPAPSPAPVPRAPRKKPGAKKAPAKPRGGK